MEQIISKVTELEHLEKEIIALKNQTAQNIIQIGYKLIEAKEKLQYGEWGVWLENKVEFSQRTANQFMRIAKEFGSNSQAISNLEITKVGLLLDVPTEKREEFIEKHDLKSMSTREIKKVIKESVDGMCETAQKERKVCSGRTGCSPGTEHIIYRTCGGFAPYVFLILL